ncbi:MULTISPECIES: hypothetical protein [unclassified Roseovarius]|uniref:hypothetical protein n=1 Tax=unclassified Roseovarius TaxID=2614913 RepID=UPI00273FAC5D|nr:MULTISPECIES: hypothetical protein [unclassified Roseovarius]
MHKIIVFTILASVTSSLHAQEQSPQETPIYIPEENSIGLIKHGKLAVFDQVTDNCWTNSSSIQSKIHLIFEQNNISVIDYQPAFYNYQTVYAVISAFGYRTKNGLCAVSANFGVNTYVSMTLGGWQGRQTFSTEYNATLFQGSYLATSGGNVNDQLDDFLVGEASKFVASVLSSRRDSKVGQYWETYPPNGDPPMSREEFQEILSQRSSKSE